MHFVCVGTPQKPGANAAYLSQVEAVIDGLAPHLRPGALVVGKSTVPVGTAARLAERIGELAPVSPSAELAWNPESLREGFAVQDTLQPDRLVVGVTSDHAETILREVYTLVLRAYPVPWISTNLATAELVKVAANAFLATKISFINAMADLCDATGGDVVTLADAIGRDPRIGRGFLSAGVGFGGGCLPKDIRAFMARAGELDVDEALGFLRHVDEINMRRRRRAVDVAREMTGGTFLGRNLAVLGAAFKPDSDDVRDSPALNMPPPCNCTAARSVCTTLPRWTTPARCSRPSSTRRMWKKPASRRNLVLHLTEWSDYRKLDPAALAGIVRKPRVLDGRNALDMQSWRAAGWTVRTLGRAHH